MFKHFRILIISSLILGGVFTIARAQEVTETPVPVVTDPAPSEPPTDVLPPSTETPADIAGIVLSALFGGAATIAGSVFVSGLVGIEKLVIPSTAVSGDTLKNITAVVVWLAYSFAIHFGLGTQFQNAAAFLNPILVAATPLIGVLIGSSKIYLAAKAHNVPIWGYART